MSYLDQIESEKLKMINDAFDAVNQPKSDFQIKHFVVGQHDTPERQYVQCVIQLHTLVCNIKLGEIKRRKTLIKIRDLKNKDRDELTQLDIDEEELALEQIEFGLKGALREFACFFAILKSFPKQFTYEEIQRAEMTYWSLRLSRQAQEDIEAHGRIGVGNQDAMWQAKFFPNPATKFIEKLSKQKGELCPG